MNRLVPFLIGFSVGTFGCGSTLMNLGSPGATLAVQLLIFVPLATLALLSANGFRSSFSPPEGVSKRHYYYHLGMNVVAVFLGAAIAVVGFIFLGLAN